MINLLLLVLQQRNYRLEMKRPIYGIGKDGALGNEQGTSDSDLNVKRLKKEKQSDKNKRAVRGSDNISVEKIKRKKKGKSVIEGESSAGASWNDDADCENTASPTKMKQKRKRKQKSESETPSEQLKCEVPRNKQKIANKNTKNMQDRIKVKETFKDKHEKSVAKQRKKEKSAMKKEQKENPQPSQRPELCFQYLDQWNADRENWKFNKVKQTWLLRNAFDVKKIPDEKFLVLMEYMQGLQGKSRSTTIAQVERLLVLFDEDVESKSITCETEGVKIVVERTGYRRIRKVCQSLT